MFDDGGWDLLSLGCVFISTPISLPSCCMYGEGASLLAGVTLLHIWAWEHISITCPIHMRFRGVGQPYVHLYSSIFSQPKLGNLEHWPYVFDTLDTMTWRPYLDYEVWDDDMELGYYF